jgi:tRNA dimethylallyltransferase
MPPGGSNVGQPPLIVLIGPTAVGKTALSLRLANTIGGEIVSADSRLFYTGMTIGVAKPTPAELARVSHHLIDIVSPAETISLAQYQAAAYTAIGAIHARGSIPILVGGTGQYVSAVIEGWGIPEVSPNPALRAELEAYASAHGPETLHARLARHDPPAAARIHPNNVRRVIRALEVFLESGTPITELQRKTPPPYRILSIGLVRPKTDLHNRINQRVDQLMQDGLLAEVQTLLAQGYDRRCPAMSGLGYRQIISHLEGECTLEEAVEAIKQETRDFARRQGVWFRKYNQDAQWFDMTETPTATIIDMVRGWLERK